MIKSMSMRMLGLALAAAICPGCMPDEPPPANGNSGGCNVDDARLAGHRKVAFRADVMPILNHSCGLSTACHASPRPKAGLVLGEPCPTGMCAPLSETAINAIHAESDRGELDRSRCETRRSDQTCRELPPRQGGRPPEQQGPRVHAAGTRGAGLRNRDASGRPGRHPVHSARWPGALRHRRRLGTSGRAERLIPGIFG